MTTPGTESRPPEPLPEQVGNYRIDEVLGSGGMGTVYRGTHLETGQVAAVKVLPASMARETGFVARFSREINAMRQLASPHIVELYESGESDGTYYYAMEYIAGETLTDRLLREKRIPWREAIDIAVQVCKALKAAHNSGIVHRDLKPSNLLIRDDGVVKLTDFGIAQVFASSKLTVTGGILGTAEYMSPEQAQGKRATKHSDIYSLGAVLYVMLTGRPPFTGKTTLDIAQKHRFAQFDSVRRLVPEVPHWLDEIVCQCLAKKPEDRYPDAYVLMLRLQEVPKKLELKSSGTFEFDDVGASRETVADDPTDRDPHGPVGATLARDLFRAQQDNDHKTTVAAKLLDNVWVLLALLVAVLGTGYYFSRSGSLSPDEMFARGEALMAKPEGPAWSTAANDYFEPLLAIDEEEWGPRVQPHLSRVQLYELKNQLMGRSLSRDPIPQSQPEAIIRQALELRRQGRSGEALEKLYALETLLGDDPDYAMLRDMSKQLRDEITRRPAQAELKFVSAALERADRLAAEGEVTEAVAIWRSVLDLYSVDPAAADHVRRAQESYDAHRQEATP